MHLDDVLGREPVQPQPSVPMDPVWLSNGPGGAIEIPGPDGV